MIRPALLVAAALLVRPADGLLAQQASLQLGGMHARYGDSLSGTAGSLSGRVHFASALVRGAVEGAFSQFTEGGWATQGGASLLALRLVGSGIGVGLEGDAAGSYIESGTLSGTASAGAVVARAAGPWLLTLSATGGALRRIDASSSALATGVLRVRRDAPGWSIDAAVSATGAGPARFADASVGIEVRGAALQAGASAGARAGDLGGTPWVQLRAAWRVLPAAALEAAVGGYPPDPTGFTDGFFASLGFRVGLSRGAVAPGFGARTEAPAIVVESVGASEVRVTFAVAGPGTLAIAGQWNDWTPAPLTSLGDGRWLAVLPVGPGVHRFALLADGSRWLVPHGVPSVPDDFGGEAGLLVVRH